MRRCEWANASVLAQEYHDEEWGRPVHDDRLLFEFLILEGAQAGLSWSTILKKREGYRKAFDAKSGAASASLRPHHFWQSMNLTLNPKNKRRN